MNVRAIYKKLKIFAIRLEFIAPELTAGGVDVRAELASDGRVDALFFENIGELGDGVASGANETGLGDLIDRNEVHMYRKWL